MLNYNEIPVELQLSSITGQMTSSHECYYCDSHGSSWNLNFRHASIVWEYDKLKKSNTEEENPAKSTNV